MTISELDGTFNSEYGHFVRVSFPFRIEFAISNSSFHRLMPINKRHFSIRMVEGRHLHRCFIYALNHGEDLKISISVGVHPAISIAGA